MPPLQIKRGRRSGGNILRGIYLLGRGKAAGMLEFGNSPEALTASLAPLIAFPLVGAVMVGMSGQPLQAALAFLSRLSGVLVLPVITQAYAKAARREGFWLCTATALNWAFWILIPLLLVAAFLGAGLMMAGLNEKRAEAVVIGLLGVYVLWLHWFIVRTGLKLSGWLAAMLVVISNLAIGVLTFGPDLLALALGK